MVVGMRCVLTTPGRWCYVCPPYLFSFLSLFINSKIEKSFMKSQGQCEKISCKKTADVDEAFITKISPSQDSTHPNRKISFLDSNTTCLKYCVTGNIINAKKKKKKKQILVLFSPG